MLEYYFMQITVPLGFQEKFPVAVSFIARHGGDRFLLNTVKAIYTNLQDQADTVVKSSSQTISASKEESAEIAKEKVYLISLKLNFSDGSCLCSLVL